MYRAAAEIDMQKEFLATFHVLYKHYKAQMDPMYSKLRMLLDLTGVSGDDIKTTMGLEPGPPHSFTTVNAEAKSLRADIASKIKTSQPKKAKVCEVCHRTAQEVGKEKLHVCSRCRKVLYCSVECQRVDWPTHKTSCK
jgi:hypothetical protein